jgi:hypothetical protein
MSSEEHFSDPARINHVIGSEGSFSLTNIAGDIQVRGVDGDEARVIATSSRGGKGSLPLSVRRSDGGLHIEVDHKAFEFLGFRGTRGSDSVEFECEVPRNARVEVNGVSSDVTVAGLGGDQSFKSVSGDIQIRGHGGRVSLTTVSGDADLTADEPVAANMTTTSGDVRIAAPMLTDLQVRSVSGDVDIRAGFAPGPEHSVESVSGDLTVESLNGLTIGIKRGMDAAKANGRQKVFGDGSAQLRFRSLSGDLSFKGSSKVGPIAATTLPLAPPPIDAPLPPVPPMPPAAPLPEPFEASESSMDILRALERGEIDVDEATRRLEGASTNG